MKITGKIKNPYQTTTRSYFAIGLLALSLISALLIVRASEKNIQVWSAKKDLAIGEKISPASLTVSKVLLPNNSGLYLAAKSSVLGKIVIRPVGAGELLPRTSLTQEASGLLVRGVPLQINRNDLPADLQPGQLIDIYALPQRSSANSGNSEVSLVASSVRIESIDIKSRDLGGAIGIVVQVRENQVLPILVDTANTRIVVARSA
jgi:hypothetical protein